MSDLNTYTFLPWLRQGIANQIKGEVAGRATIDVDLTITGDSVDGSGKQTSIVSKKVQIYGPGDITGLDSRAIIKEEPRNWITNFEPNYLPYIDFYDEDLPWRYTPKANPDNHRLQPWMALIVLKEDEFEDGKNIKDKPLPFITLSGNAKLPAVEQLERWAHVHVNQNLIDNNVTSTIAANIAEKLQSTLDENPDLAYSRIICPRKLEDKQAYHAFLVPTFESGRQAGLGGTPSSDSLGGSAWNDATVATESHQLPYYHHWYFRTGTVGDFEYLVRLLEPKPVDSRVGKRDLDVQDPGANIKGIIDAPSALDEQKLEGILKLGGALRVPDAAYTQEEFKTVEKYRNWATLNKTKPYPHDFQKSLAGFINLTDSYEDEPAEAANNNSDIQQQVTANDSDIEYDIQNNPDPLITAPLYGRWHALTQRLLKDRDNVTDISPNKNWIHELNLDPRWRVSAGFGTKVIQENQENYMKAAWDQIGDVIEANKMIREAQLAKATSEVWYASYLKPIKTKKLAKWLTLSSPVHKRVLSEGITVFYKKKESKLTTAVTSINMRKLLRPRGKFVKRLPFNNSINLDNLVTRINNGEVSAAPAKEIPSGIQTPKDIADIAIPTDIPPVFSGLLEHYPWIKWIPLAFALLILLLLLIFPFSVAIASLGVVIIGGLFYAYKLLRDWSKEINKANSILEENQTVESVDELPKSPDFRISEPAEDFTPTIRLAAEGGNDSEEAKRFKKALKDVNGLIQESAILGKVKERPKLDIAQVNDDVFRGVDPKITIPRWVYGEILLPPFIMGQFKEKFVEAKAYPKFYLPMYKPLAEYSSELFLPNINYIAQNSISILETNQKFIEAYMVGLNHEFARELLWREYPTDQRGSYFRQFWEVSGFMDTQPLSIEPLKLRFKKILDERTDLELQEFYDQLNDPAVVDDEAFLSEAHQHLLKEELKDIKPINYWSKSSELGEHDNREQPDDDEEEVVLVIRGELLKKYPTAVIYAHKAEWTYKRESEEEDSEFSLDENGNKIIDLTREREFTQIPIGQEDTPPTTLLRLPLYEAKVEPDIYFFGFDLTVCEAKGGPGKEVELVEEQCKDVAWDDAGWFFVIKERPGEPRFGLDISDNESIRNSNEIELWNDLTWKDIAPQVKDNHIQFTNQTPTIRAIKSLKTDSKKFTQQQEDKDIIWYENMNSADLAYILYQVPVLVGIHASEMLKDV